MTPSNYTKTFEIIYRDLNGKYVPKKKQRVDVMGFDHRDTITHLCDNNDKRFMLCQTSGVIFKGEKIGYAFGSPQFTYKPAYKLTKFQAGLLRISSGISCVDQTNFQVNDQFPDLPTLNLKFGMTTNYKVNGPSWPNWKQYLK